MAWLQKPQGIGKTPRQDFTAVPVHDRHQVHKPTGHGNVGDIGCPNLIGMIDGQVSEQKSVLIFFDYPLILEWF
jgi:hypothetical protein